MSPYTILEIFFTPPLFPNITKCPSKAKNYRTTKKKGSARFYTTKNNFYTTNLTFFGLINMLFHIFKVSPVDSNDYKRNKVSPVGIWMSLEVNFC